VRPVLQIAARNAAPEIGVTDMLTEIERLRVETDRLRTRIRELEALADSDPLLPLFNRRAFSRELARAISLAERYDEDLALVFFDLNGFKIINDTHGHAAGDAVLAHVADILRSNVRVSDIAGRLGGDEFGIILLRSDLPSAQTKAKQLADLIQSTPAFIGETQHRVGAAWGACGRRRGESAEALMDRADAEMYAAKPQRLAANSR
jgi:diguanylate cyclase (GGDEF)-like protein